MARLSLCIFEWDSDDFRDLLAAKKSEIVKTGVVDLSD